MRNILDLAPYRRSLIGFDRLFDLMENAAQADLGDGYPPYDVEQNGDDAYTIRMAVAGYEPSDIDVTSHQGSLIVTGRKSEPNEERKYLHRGIAAGGFERRYQLADYVTVTGANLANGILEIALRREVPEAAKPKKIAIAQTGELKRIGKTDRSEAA